ncbi:MAG: hypothetical protein K9J12_12245 [Melioribacteraceae bacterium]|nr:hypothetical protein [Melioribacteraceae bacterium]MCF8263747.1 hypothetical protein [Melioribacteraceae bacterium]MCF8412672.1 hypothetical protein [Melioribacteraceae bacterium]MCF8430982.1 hypothetical protein [Melioribacteraceae bacterium]
MKLARLILIVVAIGVTACGPDFQVIIESDTEWIASYNGINIEGEGNKTIDIPDDQSICVKCEKTTKSGFVELKLMDLSSDLFSSDVQIQSNRTTEEFGQAVVCTDVDATLN